MDIKSSMNNLSSKLSSKKVKKHIVVSSNDESKLQQEIISKVLESSVSTVTATRDSKKESKSKSITDDKYVCLVPNNHTMFKEDRAYIQSIQDYYTDNLYFGADDEEEESDPNKRVFYKMYNISHDVSYHDDLFSKFNPLLSIINKSKAKFNRKKISINFEHNHYGISYIDYVLINKKVNKLVTAFLNTNGYDNIQDFLSDVLKYEITHGVCYVYFKGNKISFLNTRRMYSIVKSDGIYAIPLYFMPIVSFADVNEVNYGISSLSNIYTFNKEDFKIKELQKLNKSELNTFLEYLKIIKSKDVVVCRYNSSENKFTGYTVSPLVKVANNIEHYSVLNSLRIESTPYWYTNYTVFKTNALDIKSIKDINPTLQLEYSKKYDAGINSLREVIQKMNVYSNDVLLTSLIDKVIDVPKDITNRQALTDEIDKITNVILKELGIDIDFINSTNKRNEDVQTSELEDYFSSYINSRQYLIEYIYKPFLKKVLKSHSVDDEKINSIMEEYDISFEEFPVTIEEHAKHTATVNNQAQYISLDEMRHKLRSPLLVEKEKDFVAAGQVAELNELAQNSGANSVNQHPTKRNANSTSKNQ